MSQVRLQLTLLIPFLLLIVLPAVLTDRRRRPAIDRLLREPNRISGRAIALATAAKPSDALAVGASAVQRLGGRAIRTYAGQAVIGWKGDMWTNIPRRAQYQYVVLVRPRDDGGADVACCARPRFVMNFLCEAYAGTLTSELAAVLREQLT